MTPERIILRVAFNVFVPGLLALDLLVFHRKTLAVSLREVKGIVIADTKFSFGLADGPLILIDEFLTPDSSRFWPVDSYQPGKAPESFGKRHVRDYLLSLNWDTRPPVPALPPEVVQKTQEHSARCFGR